MIKYKRIIDISQPVSSTTACFPGDTPFSRELTVTYEKSKVINLTAFQMSPHVGTHVDAPAHIKGDMSESKDLIGSLSLAPFIGEALIVDLSPEDGELTWEKVEPHLPSKLPARVLFKTKKKNRSEIFEDSYSYFSPELIQELHKKSVKLVGIDTPSADHVHSKTLVAHHALDQAEMVWIENLDLSAVEAGVYWLIALPLKFMELEASPIRAVLLVD
ncbi:MAG: cyclase family protein [Candidatus Obscuribacterales bacterium]|nr:cyclase family protein [Candidatus Obscuribacterales bacterium]